MNFKFKNNDELFRKSTNLKERRKIEVLYLDESLFLLD
jgi:hypothetical protein|tara:strand:- start:100 stop:213 length:114 start_codon:yes stop_codon:yes gene_type:complete